MSRKHNILFTGLIHPQAGNWCLDHPVTVDSGDCRVEVFFYRSALNVRVTFEDDYDIGKGDADSDAIWLNPIWYQVEASVRSVLDSLGFVLAASLEVEMTTGRADEIAVVGSHTSLPAFARVKGERVEGELLGKYLAAVGQNANVRHALADMRMALRLSIDTAFYCYRAIECLRHEFLQPEDGDKTGPSWSRMHAALGTSKAGMDPLTKLATARRHGESLVLSHDDRIMWLRWTRDVIAKYIEDYLPNLRAVEAGQS
ncbi:hypothetical protein [Gordonia polyisoprenivorans]|uniref:hypothetical protein n=1 Tax=Gordonia polyisoprenivorans TaxID=84595 RepID=UPI0009E3354A|nr:hypothetical protein [Gordonia polyisoprenivorans]WCB39807.1 hypothetical protein PHA63_12210 [Gordonia polyisoprenivorans]